jgi:predicted metalloprotease with PDZ domain
MLVSLALLALAATSPGPAAVSAPISNIQYDITFNRETAAQKQLAVSMSFDVTGSGDVLLSLPAWTPGAYEVTNFARWVSSFSPTAGGKALRWDKLDYDTWRIRTGGAKQVTVAFNFEADSLDNAMAWSQADFAFFNGTNVLLYPEGRSLDFPATVKVHTEGDWLVATGMHGASATTGLSEKNYHDLVDMPFFVGHFDFDSTMVGSLKVRLATYPAGKLTGEARTAFWDGYKKLFAPQAAVFGETPYDNYTTLIVLSETFGGGSALEHQSSHLGIYTTRGIGQLWMTSVTAHEMFHAFNVKRLRPAEMVPYRYDVAEPTVWLWVSEGITDYYADITLLRSGIVDSAAFLEATNGKIGTVNNSPPTALEDASLSTWIHPTDGSGYIYYPKGSLAGFMLDILIRDASDNHRSLDAVMRDVYQTTYKRGKGFGMTEWWGAVSRAAGGKNFDTFYNRYIDGREPFPWDSVLTLAGLRLTTDSAMVPRVGIATNNDSTGIRVAQVVPGGAAAEAGVETGDLMLALGEVNLTLDGGDPFEKFRSTYADKEGADLPIKVIRNGKELTLPGKVHLRLVTTSRLVPDPNPSAKAARVRHGLFAGVMGS